MNGVDGKIEDHPTLDVGLRFLNQGHRTRHGKVPAYLGCSAWLWLRGRHPYWDNPFEREAYALESGNSSAAGES
jgi:hypothetical protein